MFKTIMAAGIMLIWAAPAYSDGCNPERQDCGLSYKDEAAPIRRGYSYQVRPLRARACPPELAGLQARECRRILAEAERRRARRSITYIAPRVPRYREEPRRYRFGEDRARPDGRRCGGYFSVEGDARPIEMYARGSAIKEWRKRVRTQGPGERYVDERYSPNFKVGRCRIIGDRGVLKRCTAEGTACQP
jgi:hypothetical protein